MNKGPDIYKLMDPARGALASYAAAFIEHVNNSDAFAKKLEEYIANSFHFDVSKSGEPTEEDFYKNGASGRRYAVTKLKSWPNYREKSPLIAISLPYGFFDVFRSAMNDLVDDFFADKGSKGFFMSEKTKVSDKFKHLACPHAGKSRQDRYYKADSIIDTPAFALIDNVNSMVDVMKWVCQDCKDFEQVTEQLKALLTPMTTHPETGSKELSALEFLGLGNNGDIGQFIGFIQPIKISDSATVNKTWETKGPLLSDEFIEFWKDKDLEIGGCPALRGREAFGEIYMDFGRMFVNCVKQLSKFLDEKHKKPPVAASTSATALGIK